MRSSLSVIIPTLNEEIYLPLALKSLANIELDEVIVVDGGSEDKTPFIAKSLGARVIQSEKGRGVQLKKGVEVAKGDLLFFMHADCRILDRINLKDLYKKGIKAGFLNLVYDGNTFSLKVLEKLINLRARLLHLPYGDQGLFVERALYEKTGGFKEYPFLEDFDLVLRLRKIFPPQPLPGRILVSSRKFKASSPFLISLKNNYILLRFLFGASPENLKKFYK
ncbi:glycosyltransferase [Caldimicrobium thiodismutans]|uniref:Glycosyltransferase n=1 Tax=Caldimicrobium thiodismutans TaxID=1653476 RepID=A0A0U5AGJ1_9BACT|nr:TIGR04283 family arsenosugar biosynthesis glycosyltransferase [Caldimicrobium thiodismutans]BAU23116.1 glycosyltransferase [Caldimicrobium thiodismutans]